MEQPAELYRATAPVTLASGIVALLPRQSAPRAHNLRALPDEGLFEIVRPIEFKAGEEFGYIGQLPRSLPIEVLGNDEMPTAPASVPTLKAKKE